jgi:predicted DCC family thiol-disulfide oxidoreductase YuxK
MNNMKKQNNITVYYDGLCKVCSKEINHYKRQEGADQIVFIDICSQSFDAKAEGLDPKKIHKVMHVRRADGSMATRVDAFVEIWKYLPKYRLLVRLAKNPLLKISLETGYTLFAAIRPILPRYNNVNECSDSPYCEMKK